MYLKSIVFLFLEMPGDLQNLSIECPLPEFASSGWIQLNAVIKVRVRVSYL